MRLQARIFLALGVCQTVFGWSFLTPTSVVEGGHISFQLINPDGGGYNFPYTFTIFRNNTQGKDDQVNLQYVTATPFFWDNNQPIGAQLRFRIQDVNGFVSTTDYVQVSPNPTFVSSASVQSTASLASIGSTVTRNTSAPPPSSTPAGTQTSNPSLIPSPIKTNVGAIAGGVVGGVLILGVVTAAAFFLICRRRRGRILSEKTDIDAPIPHVTVTPFTYDASTNTHSHDGTLSPSGPISYGGSTSSGGSSSYSPSDTYTGQNDAPPIYTPPPPSSSTTSAVTRGFSQRKGAYAPVSTVPH